MEHSCCRPVFSFQTLAKQGIAVFFVGIELYKFGSLKSLMYAVADAMRDAELLCDRNFDNLLFEKKSCWNDALDDSILGNSCSANQNEIKKFVNHLRNLTVRKAMVKYEIEKVNVLTTPCDSCSEDKPMTQAGVTCLEAYVFGDTKGDMEMVSPFPLKAPIVYNTEDILYSDKITNTVYSITSKQLKKDIERDVVILNGIRYLGADVKFEQFVDIFFQKLVAVLRIIPKTTRLSSIFLPETPVCSNISRSCSNKQLMIFNYFIMQVLQFVTRSNSGLVAFQALQASQYSTLYSEGEVSSKMDTDKAAIYADTYFVPISAKATPLLLHVHCNHFDVNNKQDISKANVNKFGIVCDVETSNTFEMHTTQGDKSMSKIIKVTYRNHIMMDIAQDLNGLGECLSDIENIETSSVLNEKYHIYHGKEQVSIQVVS